MLTKALGVVPECEAERGLLLVKIGLMFVPDSWLGVDRDGWLFWFV